MRISDWSSDVCSSDLVAFLQQLRAALRDRRIFFLCAARRVAMFVVPDGSRRSFVAFNETPDTRARRIEQDFACSVTEGEFNDYLQDHARRSAEHTSELRSLMRTSNPVFSLTKKNPT